MGEGFVNRVGNRSLCRGIEMDIMAMAVTLVLDESVYDTIDREEECLRLFVDGQNEQYFEPIKQRDLRILR